MAQNVISKNAPKKDMLDQCLNLSCIPLLSGAFLYLMDVERLVKIFCDRPQLVSQHPDLLLDNLCDLDLSALLQLVEVLDPSKPVIRGFVQRKLHSRRRTSSLTSLTGSGDFGDGNTSIRKVSYFILYGCMNFLTLHTF